MLKIYVRRNLNWMLPGTDDGMIHVIKKLPFESEI